MDRIDAVLIGAGNRGADIYGRWALAHSDELCIVAVAEPLQTRRERVARQHGIPAERQFAGWEELLARPQIGRAAIIATQDQMHSGPARAALAAGYDVLLEKPMAHRLDECVSIAQAAEKSGHILQICHEMRYMQFYQRLYEIVQSERLGEIITVSHRENVLASHMAHSYVRGHWRNLAAASPMILAKCCHDMDMLYWVLGRKCERLSSVGSLMHFRPQNAPPGAPLRCTDGCPVERTCPFYAPALYVDMEPIYNVMSLSASPVYRLLGRLGRANPAGLESLARAVPPLRGLAEFARDTRAIITDQPDSREAVWRALQSGPYGRCVYHSDNDVVDHQIVAMEFEGGFSVSLTMHGHSYEESRTIRIDAARATLLGKFSSARSFIDIREHRTAALEHIELANELEAGRHGGGDQGLMRAFVTALREGKHNLLAAPRDSLESHLMAFAAEQARVEGTVIQMDDFRAAAEVSA